jgi:hypothetical protein
MIILKNILQLDEIFMLKLVILYQVYLDLIEVFFGNILEQKWWICIFQKLNIYFILMVQIILLQKICIRF